jgi:hypothetical protein
MKKLLIILGGIFLVIIVAVGIAAAIWIPRGLKLDRQAKAYIQDAVPKIVEHWSSQELVDRATPALVSAGGSRKDIDRLFAMFQKLGNLKQLDTPEGTVGSQWFSGEGTVTLGTYTARADFENGAASIRIQLRRVGDTWKINGFRINSDVFLAPAP